MDRHAVIFRWTGRAATTLLALLTVASLLGGSLHPTRTGPLPQLLATAQPLVAITVLAVLISASLLRRWHTAAVLAVCLAAILPRLLTYAPPRPAAPYPTGITQRTFTLMTFNANGFEFADKALRHRPSENIRTILRHRPDVVILQEAHVCRMAYYDLHSVAMLRDSLNALYPYHSEGFESVMILSRYPFRQYPLGPASIKFIGGSTPDDLFHHFAMIFEVELPEFNNPLRIIGVHMASHLLSSRQRGLLDGPDYAQSARPGEIAFGRYTPPTDTITLSLLDKLQRAYTLRAAQADCVRHAADNAPTADLIVCGDFNDTPSSHAYRTIAGDDLRDARADCGVGPIATYNAHHIWADIDHILYRGRLHATAYANLHEGNSDHYPQIAVFTY